MEALSKGSEMGAKRLFDTYKIDTIFGEQYTMGSDQMITNMVHQLIIDEKQDTALMFLDKLGLGEQYIKHIVNSMDFDAIKKTIDDAYTLDRDYKAFLSELKPYVDKARESLKLGNDFVQTMNKVKRAIAKLGKKYDIETSDYKILISDIDNFINNNSTNPEEANSMLFEFIMADAIKKLSDTVCAKLDFMNDCLQSDSTIINTVNNVLLDENSEASQLRKEFNKKFEKLLEYQNSLTNLQQQENSDKI